MKLINSSTSVTPSPQAISCARQTHRAPIPLCVSCDLIGYSYPEILIWIQQLHKIVINPDLIRQKSIKIIPKCYIWYF